MARQHREHGFTAIRVEGGLLPPEFLQDVSALRAKHQANTDYGLTRSLNLKDEIGRYWRIASDLWMEYRSRRARSDLDPQRTSLDEWLIPLFESVLGFHDIGPTTTAVLGDRRFPITHRACKGSVPLVLASEKYDLDRADPRFGEDGRRRAPHGLIQDYLNADDNVLWGMASNAKAIRIARDNPSLTRPAYIEVDLERIFEEQLFPDFAAFWLIFHVSRLTPQDGSPYRCVLESWRNESLEIGERARDKLRAGVTEALRNLGNGFLEHPDNERLRKQLQEGKLRDIEFFQELLRFVYRLLFLFTVEDRGLLFDPKSPDGARRLYDEGYSVSNLRERALRRRHYDRHGDLWSGLKIAFRGLASGTAPLGLPALGGLFAADQCPCLDDCDLSNARFLEAIKALTFFESGKALARVNYRDMGTEEFGSVYESLLELHPKIEVASWKFGFVGEELSADILGSERKSSGSYYTPPVLVGELIKSTLLPVIEATIKNNPAKPREALLRLKVIDLACGSGHFLLAAARLLASEIARLEAGPDTPSEALRQHALREVVQHCIYGVDKNPLAVELCKTALWIEAIEPGKPLSFLDSHIRCGDSLIGVLNPKIMDNGIADDAYQALSGDDKSIANALKKKNRLSGHDVQGRLFDKDSLQSVETTSVDLDGMPEDTIEQVEFKRKAWLRGQEDQALKLQELKANLFVGAYFSPKTRENAENVPISEDLNRITIKLKPREGLAEAVAALASRYRFFHWHLAFPDIFAQGGFDVAIGNPPWERIKLQEQEFFGTRDEEIANAPNKVARDRLIKALKDSPTGTAKRLLYEDFEYAKRESEAASLYARGAGRYPLTAVGDINTYALFAEAFVQLTNQRGRSGLIVPTGILSDDTTKAFFQDLTSSQRLFGATSFENEEFLFSGIANVVRYTLLTMLGTGDPLHQAKYAFYIRRVEQITEDDRYFSLTKEDIALLNPNTRTCPIFRSRRDAELTKEIYRRVPVLINLSKKPTQNLWNVKFTSLFHMTSDNGLFRESDWFHDHRGTLGQMIWNLPNGERYFPLYEAKFVWHYDHRFGSYHNYGKAKGRGGRGLPPVTQEEYADPSFRIQPRYWVSESDTRDRLGSTNFSRDWLIGWRDVSSAKLDRTLVPCVIPMSGVGNSLFLLFLEDNQLEKAPCLLANLSSIILDFVARWKVGGTHLNFYIVEQLPVLPPQSYKPQDVDYIKRRVIELVYSSWDLQPFAKDLGYHGSPFPWDVERRAILQAELDAYFAKLYGLTRDELRYILDPAEIMGPDYPSETFRVLKEKELGLYGEYRTQRLVLEAWDRLV